MGALGCVREQLSKLPRAGPLGWATTHHPNTAVRLISQDKYDNDVRRILTALEAGKKDSKAASLVGSARTNTARPETCPGRDAGGRTAGGAGGYANSDTTPRRHAPLSVRTGGGSSRSRNGTAPEPVILSVRSCALSGAGGAGGARAAHARSRRQGAPAGRDASLRGPETPTPRMTIAGAGAMVAGGPRAGDDEVTRARDKTVPGAKGKAGTPDGDVSPRTAKKVLPHFLAIGNPGSQALVAKEGAEIVQKQVKRLGAGISGELRPAPA